jgi:hypothetical protein
MSLNWLSWLQVNDHDSWLELKKWIDPIMQARSVHPEIRYRENKHFRRVIKNLDYDDIRSVVYHRWIWGKRHNGYDHWAMDHDHKKDFRLYGLLCSPAGVARYGPAKFTIEATIPEIIEVLIEFGIKYRKSWVKPRLIRALLNHQ